MELRIGQGFDTHRLVFHRRCVIGGITVPHSKGLEGHSDADVLLHAVCDALLGAYGEGDIGTLFPNTDPQWKDCDSSVFVRKIAELIRAAHWSIANVDCTILAEEPKLSPHFPAIREKVAQLLGVPPPCVGLKATTCEGMGAVGRGEGICAMAVVLLTRDPLLSS